MLLKLNLRKINAINDELKGIIRKNKSLASEGHTVLLRAHQTADKISTIEKAKEKQSILLSTTNELQSILSTFRRIVAEKNIEFGINEVLQELRETEDKLSILTAFLVEESTSADYQGYNVVEDALTLLSLYEEADKKESGARSVGKRELSVRLLSEPNLKVDINSLHRKIKEIKNDRLVSLNFKEVSVEITEQQKELLESLNVI